MKRATVATGNTLPVIFFIKTLKTVYEGSAVESMIFRTQNYLGRSFRYWDGRLWSVKQGGWHQWGRPKRRR